VQTEGDDIHGSEPVELPRGLIEAKMDDKGRLKLPTGFQKYLEQLPDKKFFVTSLDRTLAVIYPISLWKETEKKLEGCTEAAEEAENTLFTANDMGADAEIDSSGRILFPTTMRRELGLENQMVRLQGIKGTIQVMSDASYRQRRIKSDESRTADQAKLKKLGII
jgi:MraZ protein